MCDSHRCMSDARLFCQLTLEAEDDAMDEADGMDRSAEYLDEEAALREMEGMAKRGAEDLREGVERSASHAEWGGEWIAVIHLCVLIEQCLRQRREWTKSGGLVAWIA